MSTIDLIMPPDIITPKKPTFKEIMAWSQTDPSAEKAMIGPPPKFLFGRLPIEEIKPPRERAILCPACMLYGAFVVASVICMVMLPGFPYTLLCLATGWLLCLASGAIWQMWKDEVHDRASPAEERWLPV